MGAAAGRALRHAHRRDPGRLKIAMTAQNALGAEVDAECMHGLREGAELLAGLGHEVIEAAPALPGPETAALFTSAFAAQISLGISYGELLAGRPPAYDEIEPLSRAFHELARDLRGRLPRGGGAAPGAGPRLDRLLRRVRPAVHARAGRAPAADRRAARATARTRWRTSPGPASSRRSPRSST